MNKESKTPKLGKSWSQKEGLTLLNDDILNTLASEGTKWAAEYSTITKSTTDIPEAIQKVIDLGVAANALLAERRSERIDQQFQTQALNAKMK